MAQHNRGPVRRCFHNLLALANMVQGQEAALLTELLPEAVPLELRFHLELLIKYSDGVFR